MDANQQAVYDNIIVPAFIEKCASRGLIVTPEDVHTHLENAAMVQMDKEAHSQNLAKQANAVLKQHLNIVDTAVAAEADKGVKAAAARIVANPELVKLLS